MRISGYSQSEAADQGLQMQVCCEAEKIKGEAIPGPPAPEAVAMSALLSLLTTANVGRVALAAITSVPVAGPVFLAAGVAALPSPPRKTQKMSHQEQIARQNERKRRAIQGQAHARATIGSCRKPLINVPYKHTFGAPDQGQTLDVQKNQTIEAGFPKRRGSLVIKTDHVIILTQDCWS
jgi:hypothetical protein